MQRMEIVRCILSSYQGSTCVLAQFIHTIVISLSCHVPNAELEWCRHPRHDGRHLEVAFGVSQGAKLYLCSIVRHNKYRAVTCHVWRGRVLYTTWHCIVYLSAVYYVPPGCLACIVWRAVVHPLAGLYVQPSNTLPGSFVVSNQCS